MRSSPGSASDDPVSRRTTLLRIAADAELTPAESEELERHLQHHPSDRQVINFERRLRSEIASGNLEAKAAPDALRGRIASMCIESLPGSTPDPFRRFAFRPAWALLAAALALVATGYLVVSSIPAELPMHGEVVNAAHRSALTRFLGWQHSECEVHTKSIKERFDIGPADAAPARLAKVLQREPDLGSLRAGASADGTVEYLGAARCAVPGRGESVHIVLSVCDANEPGVQRLVSLFVQEDKAELALVPGQTYHMRPRLGDWDGRDMSVCVWRKDGLVYFLVGTSEAVLEAARISVGAQAASGEF